MQKQTLVRRLAQLINDLKVLNTLRQQDFIGFYTSESDEYFACIEFHLSAGEMHAEIVEKSLREEFGDNRIIIKKEKIPRGYAVKCSIRWNDGVDS